MPAKLSRQSLPGDERRCYAGSGGLETAFTIRAARPRRNSAPPAALEVELRDGRRIAQRLHTSMNPQGSQHADRTQGRADGAIRPARRVLVVEDEFFLAIQIEEWLLAEGCEVVDVVHTADEAVAVAERPGLVIMDIRLASDTDGIAAAVDILARTGIRCIFASAYADPPTRERGDKARPFGWLHKPFTAEKLLAAVKDAFGAIEQS
jgi:CheY-like chemotaxis protein